MPWVVRVLIFAAVLAVVRGFDEKYFVPAAAVLAFFLNPFSFGSRKKKDLFDPTGDLKKNQRANDPAVSALSVVSTAAATTEAVSAEVESPAVQLEEPSQIAAENPGAGWNFWRTALIIACIFFAILAGMRLCSRSVRPPPLSLEQAANHISSFTNECLHTYFPFAFAMQRSAVPKEARLYCAKRWDFDALSAVQSAAESVDLDIAEALARGSLARNQWMGEMYQKAEEAAKSGPPNMVLIWRIHKLLPVMYAVRPEVGQQGAVLGLLDAEDVERVKRASARIDWSRIVEQPDSDGIVQSARPMRLGDLAQAIVAGSY